MRLPVVSATTINCLADFGAWRCEFVEIRNCIGPGATMKMIFGLCLWVFLAGQALYSHAGDDLKKLVETELAFAESATTSQVLRRVGHRDSSCRCPGNEILEWVS